MAKRKPQILVTWIDPTALGGHHAKATVTPAGVTIASKMARAGHPMRGIAAAIGLGVDAFRGAVERQPDLQAALNTSLSNLEQECVGVLLKAMRAGEYTPAIFMLKGKFQWRESGPIDGGPESRVAINLHIPPGMSRAEATALISDISPDQKPEVIDAEFELLPPPPKEVIR